jgi:hypothetical protein
MLPRCSARDLETVDSPLKLARALGVRELTQGAMNLAIFTSWS